MSAINTYSITATQIYQEYQIAATGSASTSQLLAFQTINTTTSEVAQSQILVLEARGTNIVFKFGGASISADNTVTSNALASGNFSVPSGAVFEITVNGATQNYVSVISESSTGTAIIRLGTARL